LLPLAGTALLAHWVATAHRSADDERRREATLESVTPELVARAAIAAERAHLLTDVRRAITSAVESMAAQGEGARSGPPERVSEHLQRVQRDGRTAVAELRGLLGLLRSDPDEQPAPPRDAPARERRSLPRWVDVAVVVTLVGTAMLELYVWRETLDPVAPEPSPVIVATTLVAVGTIALRRSNPGLGAAILGIMLVEAATGAMSLALGLTTLVVVVTLTWSGIARLRWSTAAGVGGLAAGVCWYFASRSPENALLAEVVVIATAVASFVTAQSRAVAYAKRSRIAELTEERRLASVRAIQAQRLSVARELHDLVSHAVVVMIVQAGAAEAQLATDPPAAERAVDHILETARTTLAEVDHLFDALANDTSDVREGPAGHDIQALVDRMRAGGLDVELVSPDATLPRCPVTFRVVQESLTNALRHAPRAHVRLTLSTRPGVISVDVVDDGPGSIVATGRGYGLVGITERVERLGGRVDLGPGPGGHGFRVSARIPHQGQGAAA
jgi:signal transduction histidine kinase